MFVAEAVGSSFLGVLIDKLIAFPLLEYARRKIVDRTLEDWRKTLTHIEAVVDDAENKQIREKAVKVWLDDLKSLAYDIEDVVDEFDTKARQRSLTEGSQASTSKLDAIAKRRLDVHLREGVGGVSFGIEERLPTTSLVDESRIHGRDADKEKIIELMLSDEATQVDKVSIISIVGMGGIGKTTLAQIIYNDGRQFSSPSQNVHVNLKTLESLQEKLKNEMKEKRFFLVLDDVWNENLNHWDVLQAPFYVGAQGSVQAFKNLNSDACQNLESIGRKIAKKCKGLPLAVKTLAGSRVGELRDLSHLSGTLAILKLQNVVDARDALKSNMKGKECLDKLRLDWEDDNAIAGDSQDAASVLEKLQPHSNLKELSIGCYYATVSPEPLHVKNDVLQKVGQEFYGNGPSSFKPFGSLHTLVFKEISVWEEWDCFGVEGGEFPSLNELRIESCPKLKGDLPKHLPVLTSLVILECGQLVCQLPEAPSIQKLNLKECDEVVLRSVVHLPSITELEVSDICSIQVELPAILLKLTSLRKLVIKECQSLSSLPEMGLPPMLETLRIEKCRILETLPERMTQNNISLQSLYIEDCDSLASLPIISSLKSLEIRQCGKVKLPLPEETTHNYYLGLPIYSFYIPDGLRNMDLTSLRRIQIWDCPNLVSFPQGGLPASNLRSLWICSCMKLKSLPQRMHTLLTSLDELWISECPEIVSFPEGGLPTNLSSLHISDCYKLMESRKEWGLQTLPSLRYLIISGGIEEELESFSEEWLLPSTLFSLEIRSFPYLKSLDNLGLQNLTSLGRFEIGKCPVLRKRCPRDKGKEWRKIAHIPRIEMDGEVME
ncbi:putative disease resistance protein [Vitis vinifera]|uniref:Putative disease resistance protein n=1 Tax=Vitis vinifera TaxID=29760 RepID=A0A438GDM7_VITVI|nr:putative disease resistance protein [Vitis vinifera]